jgi:hypothetical protein
MATVHANGLLSPPATEKAQSNMASPPRVILAGKTSRILCVADIRGDCEFLLVVLNRGPIPVTC